MKTNLITNYRKFLAMLLALVGLTVISGQVLAGSDLWQGSGGGAWLTAGNWSPAGPPTNLTDEAVFTNTLPANIITGCNLNTQPFLAIGRIVIDASDTANRFLTNSSGSKNGNLVIAGIGGILLSNASTSATLFITNGTGASSILNLSLTNSGEMKVVNPGASIIIGSVIAETNSSCSITKTGNGLLEFYNSANTFSGSLTVNGGTLAFSALGSLGTGSALNFGGGALQWLPGNTADISARTVMINSGDAVFNIGANNVTLANAIGNSGTGGLGKAGTGILTLSGVNTYTGTTTITNNVVVINGSVAGSVNVANTGSLQGTGSAGSTTVTTGGTIAPAAAAPPPTSPPAA